MFQAVLLPLAVLSAIYLLIIAALAYLLGRLGLPGRITVILAFLIYGLASGLLAAWIWPLDSSVYPNTWATLAGDLLYQWSSQRLGDPWPLRVPQVYVFASLGLSGIFGTLLQWAISRWKAR